MRYSIASLLLIISVALLFLANISGIGYFLYLWGACNLAIGASAWSAFLLWIKMLAGGVVGFVLAFLVKE